MKKHVIALGRQFGSGGREIGRKLSESLGFAYYDRELLKLAAERAEVGEELFADKDEKAGNPWLFKAFYQGGPKVKQGQSAEDVLFQMQSEIIRELAEKEDCIIVGRCADLVLTGQDVDCLSLFICAPFEWRVHHRMELENLDEKAARALVEKTDAQREKYYTHYTGRPWGLPENYDICINSARLGIERTAALLAEHCPGAVQQPLLKVNVNPSAALRLTGVSSFRIFSRRSISSAGSMTGRVICRRRASLK